jgi:hypothetical protein
VQNFSTKRDPARASAILFEISVCQLLRRNLDVENLQYEPLCEEHPPNLRFQLRGVSFDLQVKQLHNTKNEITKCLFERECRRHLSRLSKPWFINFWVTDHFIRQHLNPFFAYMKRSLDQFSPTMTYDSMLGEPQYRLEQDRRTLVQFSWVCAILGDGRLLNHPWNHRKRDIGDHVNASRPLRKEQDR